MVITISVYVSPKAHMLPVSFLAGIRTAFGTVRLLGIPFHFRNWTGGNRCRYISVLNLCLEAKGVAGGIPVRFRNRIKGKQGRCQVQPSRPVLCMFFIWYNTGSHAVAFKKIKSSRPRGSVRFMSTEQIFSRSASPPTPNRPGSQPRRPGMVLHLLMLHPSVQTSD